MSSILEALKKLEADKNLPVDSQSVAVADAEFGGNEFSYDSAHPSPKGGSIAPLLWVLGGGIFTLLVIGVAVLVIMLLLERIQPPNNTVAAVASTPASAPAAAIIPSDSTEPKTDEIDGAEAAIVDTDPASEVPLEVTRVEIPTVVETVPTPKPVRNVRVAESPRPLPTRVQTATSTTTRNDTAKLTPNPEPLPSDIRSLPMLSRDERSQYRLDGVQLNMLNAAGPTRPLGNAFINLEKVFVGEVLPGTNARLVDVTSHGIAIEIQSTRQRYYIPR